MVLPAPSEHDLSTIAREKETIDQAQYEFAHRNSKEQKGLYPSNRGAGITCVRKRCWCRAPFKGPETIKSPLPKKRTDSPFPSRCHNPPFLKGGISPRGGGTSCEGISPSR